MFGVGAAPGDGGPFVSEELVNFLEARVVELEARASQVPDVLDPPPPGQPFWRDTYGHPVYEPRVRLNGQADGIRALLAYWMACQGLDGPGSTAYRGAIAAALKCAALGFADHPDHRQEWRR